MQNGEICFFDIRLKDMVWNQNLGNSIIRNVKFSPVDIYTVACVYQDKISLWDVKKMDIFNTMSAHNVV
jgi:hypothetical protein